MRNEPDRSGWIFKATVLAYIGVVYLSWLTWLVSSAGGGVAIFAFYYLPIAHAVLSTTLIYRVGAVKSCKSSAMLAIGGIAFLMMYFIAHQIVADSDLIHTVGGVALDVGVFNLIGIVPGVCLAFWLLENPDEFSKPVTIAVFTCLLVDGFLTYRLVQMEPLASKVLGTVDGMATYGQTGASGFYIANSVALLIPAVLARTRYKRTRPFWWLALAAGIAFIYTCGYLLAMAAALIAILAYGYFLAPRPIQLLALAVACVPVALGANVSALAPALNWLSDRATFYEVSRRLADLARFVTAGVSDDPSLGRLSLYEASWNAFTSNPVFGVFITNPGFSLSGHSTILDVLGGTGILGFSALIVATIGAYRMGVGILFSRAEVAGLRACYATLFFIALMNPVLNHPAIVFSAVVVAPLVCYGKSTVPSLPSLSARAHDSGDLHGRIDVGR